MPEPILVRPVVAVPDPRVSTMRPEKKELAEAFSTNTPLAVVLLLPMMPAVRFVALFREPATKVAPLRSSTAPPPRLSAVNMFTRRVEASTFRVPSWILMPAFCELPNTAALPCRNKVPLPNVVRLFARTPPLSVVVPPA